MIGQLLQRRVALISGKGGVGKTTFVAALARAAAARNKRVLVAEVGMFGDDHSPLANLFGMNQFPRSRTPVATNIFGAILLAQVGQEMFIKDSLPSKYLAAAALRSKGLTQLLTTAPSARELGILYYLLSEIKRVESDGRPTYDFIVVDLPATGHALSLTSLPGLLLKLFDSGRIADTLRDGQAVLCNGATTQAIVVSLPEPLALNEALELKDGLQRDQIDVGGIVVNMVVDCPLDPVERTAALDLVGDREILGRLSLKRLHQCDHALSRLAEGAGVPLLKIPQFAFDDVVSQMISVLAASGE